MMERKYIQKLLDSYMAAETTREEEQLLSDYFCTHRDIPAEWRDFSILFRGIRQYEQKPYVSYRRTIMKWSAAAAAIALLLLTLHYNNDEATETSLMAKQEVTFVDSVQPKQDGIVATEVNEKAVAAQTVQSPPVIVKKAKPKQRRRTMESEQILVTQEIPNETPTEVADRSTTADDANLKVATLSERDIPVTRPENYHYTPEEIALMKRQANEAYLKWMELELEIMKYNQEQTAQQ